MLRSSNSGQKGKLIMQRYHRRRHRLMWFILGPLVAVAFIYALLNRPEMPVMDVLPGKDSPSTQPSAR